MVKAALIGQSIAGSFTPEMHEAEGKALGLSYQYERWDTFKAPFDDLSLDALLKKAEAQGLAGVNVTHPFKEQVLGLVDEVAEIVDSIGSINTILFRGGKRIGYNTDYYGFSRAFESELADEPCEHVLLLGAGGAGKAVALSLLDQGVSTLSIYDLNPVRSEELITRIRGERPRVKVSSVNHLTHSVFESLNGLVNTTPVGMDHHPGTPMDINLIHPDIWIADIIYFPNETKLLREARLKACKAINGAQMAIYQAAQAFELITEHRPDANRMRSTFQALYEERLQRKAYP